MAKREIGIGIIGCGLMGREIASASARWCDLLNLDFAPKIVGICDTNPATFNWFQTHFDSITLATRDYQELLGHPGIEVIYCAVPHHLHERFYIDIISVGKHLLGEKPFGIDRAANARIMDAIRANPDVLVRCSSEFPFFPGAQKIVGYIRDGRFGQILEVEAGFHHSSDLNPNKPINWKRQAQFNGESGSMSDLGIHMMHIPLRFGWLPHNLRALLSNVVPERPDRDGNLVPCDTWDNATLACEVKTGDQSFPMLLSTKRIAPGETNTWYIKVLGTRFSAEFTTKYPRTLRTLSYEPGGEQAWQTVDLGYDTVYPSITGGIFEFGFPDAVLQMLAAFCDELVHGPQVPFSCATPEETELSHRIIDAALESQRSGQVVTL